MDELSQIAVVAMAGKFPAANSVEVFWRNLLSDNDCFTEFAAAELEQLGMPAEILERLNFVKRCPQLLDAMGFDAYQLGCSTEQAIAMAPQARLMLATCRELMQQSGYSAESFNGLIGFWGGQAFDNYPLRSLQANHGPILTLPNPNLSNELISLSEPLSKFLNLNGPVINIQTACSTSLVAVHQAALALATFQCDIAIAGGVSIQYGYLPGYEYRNGEILSPDGYCRSFDALAQGTVFGEGCAVVMLRRLEDALADGDQILGLIRGSAVNNDGRDRAGFIAPGVSGQVDLLRKAYGYSGVNPEDITYIETHGTGTQVGDPLEISALKQFFANYVQKENHCALGALKANIGHLDAAAGVAGMIKLLCSLNHNTIPKMQNFSKLNEHIEFEGSPFYIPTKTMPWQSGGKMRTGAVSSFGMGGTNAHIILSNYEG